MAYCLTPVNEERPGVTPKSDNAHQTGVDELQHEDAASVSHMA